MKQEIKHVKVHCASLMDICHLKNAELEKKHQEYKGRVVLLGDIVKDDSGSYAVFTEHGSSASRMTAAKVMDIIWRTSSWRSICLHSSQHGRFSEIAENSKMSRHLDTSTTTRMGPNHGPVWKTQSFLLIEVYNGHLLAGLLWKKAIWETSIGERLEKTSQLGMLIRAPRERFFFLSVYVDDVKMAGKKQNIDPIWKVLSKDVDLGQPTSFLDHVLLGLHSKTMWNKQYCWQLQNHVRTKNLTQEQRKKTTKLGKTEYFYVVLRCGRSC